ncbi:MAG: NHLP family bacteriocin export ABC transporter peptidase/permease/ATPase subunit [Saccharofermentans sp.]|nr:NHLP family bacteriocin export ABC transporter peptidase/permease/ATPase subunit [Saccharofermentans sp.]
MKCSPSISFWAVVTDVSSKKDRPNKAVKVPVIPQMEALECGAACLDMILAYYGKWVPLEEVRRDCGVSRDGSNAANVARAAAGYGLKVKAKSYGTKLIRAKASYPCIIWWNYNHFVVLDGFKKDKAILNDPARGRVLVSAEEFDSSYCNLCLEFQPGESFERGGKRKSVLGFFAGKIKGNGAGLTLIMLTAGLSVAAGVFIPVFSRVFSDNILSGENPEWLEGFLVIFAAMIFFQFAVNVLNRIAVTRVSGKMAVTSNVSFMQHLLKMPLDFFSQRMAGDLASRQAENDIVAKVLAGQLAPTSIQIVLLVFYLVVMLRYSIPLSIVGIVTVIVNLIISHIIANKRMEISRIQMRDEGKLTATTMSGIDMIETIKAAGAESGFYERWSGYHAAANRSSVAFAKVDQLLGPLPSLIQQLSTVVVLSLGARLIVQGHMTAGIFLAFQGMLTAFLNPVNLLLGAGEQIQQMRSSMERIDDVMNYPEDSQFEAEGKGDITSARKLTGAIEIDNITFGYSSLAEPLIKDFSLTVRPGERIAFVGSSGSGKSTISKLIAGLYEPWEGSIRFDGKTRREIPRDIFSGSLSVVDQDVVMFADTIENNISMWDETIEDYDMILAARDADIYEDIMKNKGGFKYKLEESGRNISGGQRQRLEIARVLASDPSIVIMDEATSALDAKTEHQVAEAIRARNITTFIVAHRLSTIRDCDKILVFDNGKVVESGTHDELIKAGGLYKELVTTE